MAITLRCLECHDWYTQEQMVWTKKTKKNPDPILMCKYCADKVKEK